MDWSEYLTRIRKQVPEKLVRDYGMVMERGRPYPLVCLDLPTPKTLVVTAGFHGEEPAGPLLFAYRLMELVEYAQLRGVGLRIYPCINPSGFVTGERYNLSGEKPNNAVIEYEIEPGRWVGEIEPGQHEPHARLQTQPWAKETWALMEDLRARPIEPAPVALLDIHQDNEVPDGATYAYVFGGRRPYERIMTDLKFSEIGYPLSNEVVDPRSGGNTIRTDVHGLCEYHDGSISAWAWSLGSVIYTVTLETSSLSPPVRSVAINLLWVKHFIDLVAQTRV